MESSPSSELEAAAAAAINGICSRSAAPVEVTMANSCSSQERLGDETTDSSCTGTGTGGSEVHVIVPRTPEEHQAFLQTQRQVQTIGEEEEKCEDHQDLQAAASSSTTGTDHESAKSKSNLIPPSKQQPRGKTPAKRGLRKNGSSESDSSSAEMMMMMVPLPAMRGLRKNSYTCTDRRISDHNHHLPREETADVNANLSLLEELASGVEPLPVEPAAPALLRNSTHNYRQSLPGAFAQMPGVAFSQQPNNNHSAEHHDDDDHHRNSTSNATVETASATTEGLVQARQVTDDELESSSQLQQARAVTARQLKLQQKHRQQQSSFWQNKPACGILSVVLAAVVVAILLGVGLAGGNKNKVVTPITIPLANPQSSSEEPSPTPSAAPTGTLDILLDSLPKDTLNRINQGIETPQWKAWQWLANHKNITFLPEWRKTQLFALATFFYAFEGENWKTVIKERWMDDTMDECLWFSSGFGYFDDKDEQYIEWPPGIQVDPCNDLGKFTSLELFNLQLSGLSPSMPPEMVLLTDLRFVSAPQSHLHVPLEDLIPMEFSQLEYLDFLAFLGNDIVGTIPSHLGLFPVLADLRLHNNPHLSGSLPTELGMLTRMMQLDLSNLPLLTGTIPSELALLTANLSYLNFTGSHGLSGPISSELCSLLNKNCSYKPLPWDPWYELPCALEFDCRPTEGLCGCDCPCSDNTL